ncbi:MAG: hypothetical protein HRU25_16245 [Psychrobium sp.]|nr:hypothetical protein [Psychrobium sp.]
MVKFLLFVLLLVCANVHAVSLDNSVFTLNAQEIHFKVGEITAKRQVVLRIKSLEAVAQLASKNNIALSQLTQENHTIHIFLADGWALKGCVSAISVDGESAVIESDQLYIYREQLVASQ